MPEWLEAVLQSPALISWLLSRFRSSKRHAAQNEDRWLTPIVMAGGMGIAIHQNAMSLFFLTTTIFIAGNVLLELLQRVYVRIDALMDRPRELLLFFWKPWLATILMAAVLLTLPVAVQSGVSDYTYRFWSHLLNSAFAAVSAACLIGNPVYSLGEDYTRFGQLVLLITSQLAGLGFSAIGLAVIRPFLSRRIRLRTVLTTAMTLQFAATAILATAWRESDTPHAWDRCLWSLVYAGDAIWNTGFILRPNGLGSYISNHVVFICITTLSIIGSLGIPIILDLIRGRPKTDYKAQRDLSLLQRLPRFDAAGTFLLLLLGALLLFYFETPSALPTKYVPDRPFDLGAQQVALRDDMSQGQRWSLAVFVSSTVRSAGLQSIPLSEGAISWPSYGMLLIWMFIGGSAGGPTAGIRISSLALLMIFLFRSRSSRDGKSEAIVVRRLILRRIPIFILLWIGLTGFAVLLLSMTSSGSAYERVFEATAALNNVGLSTGLSLHLTPAGRLVMILVIVASRLLQAVFWLRLTQQINDGTSRALLAE